MGVGYSENRADRAPAVGPDVIGFSVSQEIIRIRIFGHDWTTEENSEGIRFIA